MKKLNSYFRAKEIMVRTEKVFNDEWRRVKLMSDSTFRSNDSRTSPMPEISVFSTFHRA